MSWKWLNSMPNTQATLAAGIFLALGTGLVVFVSVVRSAFLGLGAAWEPPSEWLWFISGLVTVGVGGVIGKRVTDQDYGAMKKSVDTTTTTTTVIGAPPPVEP